MQTFQLKDLLQALGPTASLIFAAWIFLSYLQQRYSTAYEHYRALLSEYRQHAERDKRRDSLHRQIFEYKRRCEQMRSATTIGVASAILLLLALICGALGTIDPAASFLKYMTAACAILGLLLVIAAATLVIMENHRLQVIIDIDLSDVDDLQHAAQGRRPAD